MASTQQEPVAPLALSTVKQRYPRLFREYTFLSIREKETADDIGGDDNAPAIDPATGQCTTIMFNDFTKPLEDNDGCPMKTASDANKFCIFLWKMLDASESGSTGGDACRQFDVLNEALEDILTMTRLAEKFEHLLGWTCAAAHHGLYALLYRGDPDRNRAVFKIVGDEWKKVFEKTANNDSETGVSEELRKFAICMCETFCSLLKQAKKEYGDYAKYTFNFIKKTRARKGPVSVAKNTLAMAAASAAPTNAGGSAQKAVTVVITKSSAEVKLGIGIDQEKGATKIMITSISLDSLFVGTDLKVGMILDTINGTKYNSFAEGLALLKAAEGQVTIVASAVTAAAVSSAATANGVINQKENSVPAKDSRSETDDEPKPWECDDWVPMRGGKQKSPNMIRNELQKYIDQCKADGTMTQTHIIEKMGVNNNTFRRFMNPKTYKDQWSATQNGTYWAAARLLEEVKYENEKAKKSGAKRKTTSDDETSTKKAKGGRSLSNNAAASVTSSKMSKARVTEFLNRVNAVEGVPDDIVFDSCPQLVTKIKTFLQRDGMSKAHILRALGNINSNSLNRFLSGKGQDQCANVTYKAGYVFFEKLRVLEGQKKSNARLKNEREHPTGFSLTKSRGGFWFASF